MKLKQFRVTNFRSVEDSGWIEVDDVTALIGVNESGKTNLLLPLWKLKPARDGDIQPTSDYPKTMFGEIREAPGNHYFIEADFETGEAAAHIAAKAGISVNDASIVRVTRFFDGSYYVEFPQHEHVTCVSGGELRDTLENYTNALECAKCLKQENDLRPKLVKEIKEITGVISVEDEVNASKMAQIIEKVDNLIPAQTAKSSAIIPLLRELSDDLKGLLLSISGEEPGSKEDVIETVIEGMPSFVYYSNYGNLDSEIYLPHVVENLERDDLGAKESAKVRTLRVLFRFVRLQAHEILELGQEFEGSNAQPEPTPEEIEDIAEKKRTRSILLQSAGTTLTDKFRDWWKQGDYRFRFEADGNHFRIWVADDRRPAEVELEHRSSGLQWFLSFYLVFLVESQGQHRRAILLLDEPGMSLHPLAQRDLSAFFDNLSRTNQLLYTSHSPFLVDADRLERARKVYVASDGTTKATSNLRHSEGRDEQAGAAYAVHSALNLSVAESLLLGCQPVLVEGASDQHYLTAIKSLLVSAGKITPDRELVFPPSGGAKTVKVVASILTGRDEVLPFVLLDSDVPGAQFAQNLKASTYSEVPDRVLSIKDFVGFDSAETEDLFPTKFLASEMDRIERDPDERLADIIRPREPFVPQVERWAESQGVTLDPDWKVKLAARAKQRALKLGIDEFADEVIERWTALFSAFCRD